MNGAINDALNQAAGPPMSIVASAPMIRRRLRWQVARLPVLPAFDLCLKCSHLFNILDARGAISVTERVGVIARIRALAVGVAKAYVEQQQEEGKLSEPSRAELENVQQSIADPAKV